MNKILLLHGANLNWLGKRDVNHYGKLSLKELEELTAIEARKFNYQVIPYQSNHEGNLIDVLQSQASQCKGIIINAGAFTHYSYALHDALLDTGLPVIEVHLSELEKREEWRQKSVIASACIKVISGKKEHGYVEAINILVEYGQDDK